MNPDLWQFAVTLYQRPSVETTCLQLQAQGADVCLLLCAAWLEARHVVYNATRADALRTLARSWQQEVIEPLREMRQAWRARAQSDNALALLREQVKRLELAAERTLLERLGAHSQSWLGEATAATEWLEYLAGDATDRDALNKLRIAAAQITD